MPSFKCAHVREQGIDLIIVPVNSSFAHKSESEQHDTIEAMQLAATSAGLTGTVVPIWNIGNRTVFIAPQNWHPFVPGRSVNERDNSDPREAAHEDFSLTRDMVQVLR